MLKVTSFADIAREMNATIEASYKGYEDYAPVLDTFVGRSGIISDKDYSSVQVDMDGVPSIHWYPPYALKISNDDSSIKRNNIIIGNDYIIMKKLREFSINPYRRILPIYNSIEFEEIFSNYIHNNSNIVGEHLKALQIIPAREEYNDIIVLCQNEQDQYIYVPITSLYEENRVPLYMRSAEERRNRFVYEYKDWKNNIV